jgi:hypothetical protein
MWFYIYCRKGTYQGIHLQNGHDIGNYKTIQITLKDPSVTKNQVYFILTLKSVTNSKIDCYFKIFVRTINMPYFILRKNYCILLIFNSG